MDTNASAYPVPECEPEVSGDGAVPAPEWLAAAQVHSPAVDLTDQPVIAAQVTAAARPAPDTKTVVMFLSMGLAMLASQKPEMFSWLVHESLALLPTLVLAFGLRRIGRFEETQRTDSPEAVRGALVLAMAAAVIAVLGVPGI